MTTGPVITPVTECIGAEVGGVDLRRELDDETVAALRRGLLDHLVLFFRDQPLSPAEQLRFAERFAPVMLPVIDTASTEQPGVTVLDQTDPRGQYTDRWHTDSTFLAEPPMAAILRAVQLPPVGGDTCFASMYRAYETLPTELRHRLDRLTAFHSTEILDAALARIGTVIRRDGPGPPARHPVVRVHPETGRKALFVNANFTTRIVELDPAESDALLATLFAHVDTPELQVRFRWEPASVVLWDERATQHRAVADYRERRVMHRCMMRGDRPIGPAGEDT